MAKKDARYRDRIIRDPAILTGKPIVKGTRIPVALVLKHLALNPDLDELFAAYPCLTIDDAIAVRAYAGAEVEGEAAPPSHSESIGLHMLNTTEARRN